MFTQHCVARGDNEQGTTETMRWMVITIVAIVVLFLLLNHVVTHIFN
jgi:hypothetical protein